MMTRRTFVISSKLTACGAVLLTLTLVAMASTVSGQQVKRSSGSDAPQIRRTAPADAAAVAARQRFLEMFARAYFPGRTGQLLIVPREGDFITRPDQDVAYMHGSPWAYDVSIPLMFAGPAVRTERVLDAGRAAGRCANACGRAGCVNAADCDRPSIAGLADWLCSTARCLRTRSGWHAARLLRSVRRCDADAFRATPARRVVQSGPGQLSAYEHRRWTLDDRDWHRSLLSTASRATTSMIASTGGAKTCSPE